MDVSFVMWWLYAWGGFAVLMGCLFYAEPQRPPLFRLIVAVALWPIAFPLAFAAILAKRLVKHAFNN